MPATLRGRIAAALIVCGLVFATPDVAWAGKPGGEPVPDISTLPKSKLIDAAWVAPSVGWLSRNLDQVQSEPVDGLFFKVNDKSDTFSFDTDRWTTTSLKMGAMSRLDWGRLTDRFLFMQSFGPESWNWETSAGWSTVLANMRVLSEVSATADLTGVAWEPEFHYEANAPEAWGYSSERYPDKSFAEMETIVRARGGEFMEALQSADADLKLFAYHLGSWPATQTGLDRSRLADARDALFPAFFEGMLSSVGPNVSLIDGNKPAYTNDDTQKFTDIKAFTKQDVPQFLDPSVRDTYAASVSVAQPIYLDHIWGLTPFSPVYDVAYQRAWLEHNVYQALMTTDEYAWIFTKTVQLHTSSLPEGGILEAITAARDDLSEGLPLGFDMVKTPETYNAYVRADLVTSDTDASIVTVTGGIEIDATSPTATSMRFFVDGDQVAVDLEAPFSADVVLGSGSHWVFARGYAGGEHQTSQAIYVP